MQDEIMYIQGNIISLLNFGKCVCYDSTVLRKLQPGLCTLTVIGNQIDKLEQYGQVYQMKFERPQYASK